ncbi:MAG: hypothetical protein EBS55_13970, partial [Flavobacteriaceae bacterium]|nr:hypothetical protein [Flavobacteriaceae bacterium]
SIWGIPKRNQIYSAKPGTKEAKLASLGVSASGFIPNFAIPVDSARIPWFKKYASSYKNTASDKDVFRQIDFPTYGKGLDHSYAKIGNPDMISFLYEDFVRSAMNIALGSKQIVRSKEAGFKHTPTNDISNRDPIDLAKKLAGAKFRMLEVKQSKNNQKETISQISDAKLRGFFEENPQLAKNVELMSIIFNDPRYVDPTGKNPAGVLSPFEQSIAPIVKNSYADVDPVIKSKLSKITDGLLRRYQAKKNLFSKGFIPNFGNLDVGARSMLVNSGIIPFVVDLQRKTMAASSAADDMFHSQIVNKKFLDPKTKKPIYPKLYGDDIHSAAWKDIFVRGFVDSSTGKVNFDLTAPQKEDKNFMQKYSTLLEQVKAKYAEKFKSAIPMKPKRVSPLAAFRSNGFIPNFANFIDV